MTPVQKIAMGLVVVFLEASFHGYDALADPIGWGLVIAGLLAWGSGLPDRGTGLTLAALAGLASVVVYLPVVGSRLAPSGQWAVSLPQTAFCFVLCSAMATVVERADDPETTRFTGLRWTFVVVGVGPVVVYGGGVDALAPVVAALAVLANVYLVYLLFKVSRRPYTAAAEGAVTRS